MKKVKAIIKYTVLLIFLGIIGLISYVKFVLPNVGIPENIKIELSPERIERGKYLANSICVCMDCHSTRDWNKFSGPLLESTYGMGGEEFNQKSGFPGKFYASNITPFALKDWTDGEILRAISCGVNKNGKALFSVMPHANYGKLDREDLYSVIAFLRTLKPVEKLIPKSKPDFPMNFIINTIPKKAEYSKIPNQNDIIAYGSYLFTAASCNDCHTRLEKGKPIPGLELAGGFEFPLITGGVVSSSNITPDKETGIGNWSEDFFVNRFISYADSSYSPGNINKGDYNTIMPWMMYRNMKSEDMKAIYAFLKTVKPVKNVVIKFTAKEN
jgi:hypothetical protein